MSDLPRPTVELSLLDVRLSICRLPAGTPIPPTVLGKTGDVLTSITRTRDELSVVAPASLLYSSVLPANAKIEPGWRAFGVVGQLDFSLIGIMAALAAPLAAAKVSIFAISTYDTDYILVREESLNTALAALREAGHTVNV